MIDAAKRIRAACIRDLIHAGWSPPPLTDRQADRLLEDIGRVAGTVVLSGRERRVLALTAAGLTNDEIADRMGWSLDTIKNVQAAVRGKLGARSKAHAVAVAYQDGLL